eukprot:s3784_g1.t1
MIIVLTNSVWIGVEADAPHRTNMAALNAEQTAIEHLFCLVFTLEIAGAQGQLQEGVLLLGAGLEARELRVLRPFELGGYLSVADLVNVMSCTQEQFAAAVDLDRRGPKRRLDTFRRKRDCLKDFWFGFDGALVVLMIGEVWMLPLVMFIAGVDSSDVHAVKELTILRTVRLLRLTRLGRIARLLRAVPEVVTLLKGIAAAIRSVFFTLLLLLVLLFVFGVVFKTQAKEDARSNRETDNA